MQRIILSFLAGIFTLGTLAGQAAAYGAHHRDNPITSGLHQGATYLQFNTDNGWQIQQNDDRQQHETGSAITEGQAQRTGTYAALGDSIAAGAGLAPSEADDQCQRSTQAYGYLVAQQRNLTLLHVACGGATAGDLFTMQRVSGPNIVPQLDTAFASGTPALITLR